MTSTLSNIDYSEEWLNSFEIEKELKGVTGVTVMVETTGEKKTKKGLEWFIYRLAVNGKIMFDSKGLKKTTKTGKTYYSVLKPVKAKQEVLSETEAAQRIEAFSAKYQ